MSDYTAAEICQKCGVVRPCFAHDGPTAAADPAPEGLACRPECGPSVSTWHVPSCPNAPDWLRPAAAVQAPDEGKPC